VKTILRLLILTLMIVFISCAHGSKKAQGHLVQNATEVAIGDRKMWLDMRTKAGSAQEELELLFATGDWQQMEAQARQLLRTNPRDRTGLSILAIALSMQGKATLADYYADLFSNYHGRSSTMLNIKALSRLVSPHQSEQTYEEIAVMFQEAFYMNPSEIAAGLNLGFLHLETARADAAVQVFAETVNRCGQCTPANLGLGIAKQRTGDMNAAMGHFEQVLSQDDRNVAALYRLSLLSYYHKKDLSASRNYMRRLFRHVDRTSMLGVRAEAFMRTIDQMESEEYEKVEAKSGSNEYYDTRFLEN
jgi:tetratricopeptide (TPR) repeat protein